MSNYLAIATVTAVLQQILQDGVENDIPGTQVTTVRPDKKQGVELDKPGINIYLYQVTPNPAWRNADLRTRRPKGDLSKQRQTGLDLHYLFSFYGNEKELIPQRLLGSAVRTLVDRPILGPEILERLTSRSRRLPLSHSYLAESNLIEQVQKVKIFPSNITTEDLSRIWSVFFQTPYSLSVVYQGTVVLIEGEEAGKKGLPISGSPKPTFYSIPHMPKIESIEFMEPGGTPQSLEKLANQILAQGTLIIQGQNFKDEEKREEEDREDEDGGDRTRTYIQLGNARLTPQFVSTTQLQLDFDALEEREKSSLRAGIAGLKVIKIKETDSNSVHEPKFESNAFPITLRPRIMNELLENPDSLSKYDDDDEDGLYFGELNINLDVDVETTQRVFLLLNQINGTQSYVFRRIANQPLTHQPTFKLERVKPSEYLVRVQIDGAESHLFKEVVKEETDQADQQTSENPPDQPYNRPKLVLP